MFLNDRNARIFVDACFFFVFVSIIQGFSKRL